MKKPWMLGLALGMLLSLANALTSAGRGDPHTLRIFPSGVSGFIQPALIYLAILIVFRGFEGGLDALRARTRAGATVIGLGSLLYAAFGVAHAAFLFGPRPLVFLLAVGAAHTLVPAGFGGLFLAQAYAGTMRTALAEPAPPTRGDANR